MHVRTTIHCSTQHGRKAIGLHLFDASVLQFCFSFNIWTAAGRGPQRRAVDTQLVTPELQVHMSEKVYILDEVTILPGMASSYRDAYLAQYGPEASDRGMTLESVKLTPPFEMDELPSTLQFTWSMESVSSWWAMRIGGSAGRPLDTTGENMSSWWKASECMIVSRTRRMLIDFSTPTQVT